MPLNSKAKLLGLAAAIVLASAVPALAVGARATTDLNVRTCGSTDCRVIDVLHRGEFVDVEFCQDTWCAIDSRGEDGWVNANYLSRGDFDDGDDRDYDDDDDFDDFYIVERRHHRHERRLVRRYDPYFGACVGGPNARLCVFD